MSELITKQAMKDMITNHWSDFSNAANYRTALACVDAVTPIQSEPHWIPVTEPPTDRMVCYVTLKDTKDENRQNWVAEMIYTPWDGFDLMDGIEAIAWMPKQYPEPYKGVTDGTD